jgi:hypothetical protein
MSWHVLGFDIDDIVGAGQDWRLARQCVAALVAAARPPTDGVMESQGAGEHLTFWYVRDDVAAVLDDAGVPWRRFAVGMVRTPPASACEHLKSG